MKKAIIIAAVCWTMAPLQAQKKYEKIIYQDPSTQTDEMMISAKNGVSNKEMTKFKLQIANKSDDVLLFKPDESVLKINGKDVKPNEKPLQIDPTETDSRVVNFTGTDFMVTSYSYYIDGIYKVSTTSKAIETADFNLPPSQNEFTTGNFTCNMTDLSKETGKTEVKFECRYTGDKIGVIHPGRAAIKLPDGTEIANAKSKKSPVLLMKGESKKITLAWNRMEGGKATDMQKVKLQILWRNTFVESEMVKLKPVTLDFKIDEGASK